MVETKLTPKQQKFVDAYDGNATQAALAAGYSPTSAKVIGHENLTKPYIIAAIKARSEKPRLHRIATREERQAFWTRVMNGEEKEETVKADGSVLFKPPILRDRLRASELLGRSEADFTENVNATHRLEELTLDEINKKIEELQKK